MKRKLFVSVIIMFLAVAGFGQQTREEILQRQKELQQELNNLNASLSDVRKSKKISLRELNLIQRKIAARESLIRSINNELADLDQTITANNQQIIDNTKELDTLKRKYAESLVLAYKNRNNYSYVNFLFSSVSFNDAFRRIAYLKSYRQYRATQAADIIKAQQTLKHSIANLESSKTEKGNTLVRQNSQLQALQTDRRDKDNTFNMLKGREGSISKEIAADNAKKRKLQQVLQAVIRREVAEAERKERARQAQIAAARKAEDERARKEALQKALAAQQQRQQAATPVHPKSPNTSASTTPAPSNTTTAVVTPKRTTTTTPTNVETARGNRSYNVLESTNESLTQSLDFEKNRGHLPWPVNGGFISEDYGVQSISGTNLRQVNDGVEISTNSGNMNVKAVATGTVSVVISDDGYSVIIRHGKYFTTYSNLSSVIVNRGDNVNAGTVIGKMTSDGSSTSSMFFMVTDSRGNSLNPLSWLSH